MRKKPLLKIAPGIDFIVNGGCPRPDRLQVRLQNLVHEMLFVLEVVIELPLAGL